MSSVAGKPIRPAENLAVTLRYLSTGDYHQTIAFSYRLGHLTVTLSLIYFDISTHADFWAFLFWYNAWPLFHTSYLFCTASIRDSTNSFFQSIFVREFICSAIFLSGRAKEFIYYIVLEWISGLWFVVFIVRMRRFARKSKLANWSNSQCERSRAICERSHANLKQKITCDFRIANEVEMGLKSL